MQQLQEFFQKQEAFNARVEESLQQRVEETGKRRQTRRLPNAVMVSSLFFAIVVVTSNVYSFCGIFTLLKFSAKTISSSCREVRGSGGWKLNYGYCFQNCEYSKISETSGNSDSVSTQVAGLTLVTRALATCTRERARRRRDSLNVQHTTQTCTPSWYDINFFVSFFFVSKLRFMFEMCAKCWLMIMGRSFSGTLLKGMCRQHFLQLVGSNEIRVSTQVAGLTLVTRALATCTRERARRRRDSLNVQHTTQTCTPSWYDINFFVSFFFVSKLRFMFEMCAKCWLMIMGRSFSGTLLKGMCRQHFLQLVGSNEIRVPQRD